MTPKRIVIVGGPSRGKSTLAHEFHLQGYAVFCGDPASTVVYQKPYTTYLPEGLGFAGNGGGADWVARNWLSGSNGGKRPMPNKWVCEGHVMARALRRWMEIPRYNQTGLAWPCDRVIVLDKPAHRETSPGQEAMHKGVMTVWSKISDYFDPITEWRRA